MTVDVCGGDLDNNVEHIGQVILLQPAAERFILTGDVAVDGGDLDNNVGQVILLQPAAERYILTVDVNGGDFDNNVEHVGQVILLQSAAKWLILLCNDDDVDNIV